MTPAPTPPNTWWLRCTAFILAISIVGLFGLVAVRVGNPGFLNWFLLGLIVLAGLGLLACGALLSKRRK